MRQITNFDCMSQAVITATTTEFPSEWSKDEREKAEQELAKREYKRLCEKYGLQ